ncbi:hypothetical protein DFP72DRAFT_1077897 [Ephemerocybe angulata]|uniref:Uncharacterized protein n=1 Tax=Ephemerocybe angulata TaxID=980116 RepID=A0A8H6HFQ3_9AGAR|nr:hypothetical protein DFP72DRAFT_1077897 [Tulosesus angulatus]
MAHFTFSPGNPSSPYHDYSLTQHNPQLSYSNAHYRCRRCSCSRGEYILHGDQAPDVTSPPSAWILLPPSPIRLLSRLSSQNVQPVTLDSLQILAELLLNADQPDGTNSGILRYLGADIVDPTTNALDALVQLDETTLHPVVPILGSGPITLAPGFSTGAHVDWHFDLDLAVFLAEDITDVYLLNPTPTERDRLHLLCSLIDPAYLIVVHALLLLYILSRLFDPLDHVAIKHQRLVISNQNGSPDGFDRSSTIVNSTDPGPLIKAQKV